MVVLKKFEGRICFLSLTEEPGVSLSYGGWALNSQNKRGIITSTHAPTKNLTSCVYDVNITRAEVKLLISVCSSDASESMSHAPRHNCICSCCFVRNYELYNYENRSAGSKKRGSLAVKPFRPLTAEEVERTFWKSYLQKLQDDRRKAKVVVAVRKPPKKVEEVEIAYEIRPSKVFLESPTSADDCRQVMDVHPKNFWDFVYRQMWKGRIRVCEGELMYKITETLKTLVTKKKIANFTVTRMFTAQSTDNEEDSIQRKEVNMYSEKWRCNNK